MSPPPHLPPPPPHHPPPQHHPPPPQQPPQHHQFYPYPPPHHHRRSKPSSSKPLASCILATCFLTILIVAAAITCFILFRPQNPAISVTTMKLPTFSSATGNTTVNFTLIQYATVRNPNRYEFTHHGSSVQLASPTAGAVGFIYIPAAQIAGGRAQYVTATFDVKSLAAGPGPTMELETKMRFVGSVKVMKVFAHHVDTSVSCRLSVQVSDGSLLGFHC